MVNTVVTAVTEQTDMAGIKIEKAEDNLITRVTVPSVAVLTAIKDSSGFDNNSGYFYEYVCKNGSEAGLMELRPLFDEKRCQTVSYIGDKDMFARLIESGANAISLNVRWTTEMQSAVRN